MKYSIVVPCFNDGKNVERLFLSCGFLDKQFEFIVVDDASKDNTVEILKKYPIQIISLECNCGPAVARNRGVREATGDVIVFCDSDILISDVALGKIKHYFEHEKESAIMACGLLLPHNPGFFPRYKYYQELIWAVDCKDTYVNHFSARFGAIKKDMFTKVGGFDESFSTASVEDYDFGYRMKPLASTRRCHDIYFSHRNPYFMKQAILYFKRTAEYVHLTKKNVLNNTFKTIGATRREAVTVFFAALSQFSLILSSFSLYLGYVFLFLFAAYLFRQRKLFILIYSKENILFTLCSVLANYILCSYVILGAVWGAIKK